MFLALFGGVLAVCSAVAFVAFTIVPEHGGRFLSMCLRCVCVVLEALLAWRSSSIAFLLVPLSPSAFLF